MISMKLDADATDTSKRLAEASRSAKDVEGTTLDPVQLVNEYREWANKQVRALGSVLDESGLDEAIRTRAFWAVMGGTASPPHFAAISSFVRNEMSDRIGFLSAQADSVRREIGRWQGPDATDICHAIVLDTNVLLQHFDDLETMPWAELIDVQDASISLAITRQAVRELDGLKKSTNKVTKNGSEQPVRSLARQALKQIDDWFQEPDRATSLKWRGINADTGDVTRQLTVLFVLDDIAHLAIPDHDAEIVSRAMSITPFVSTTTVVSYDTAITLQARQAGLRAIRLKE